MIFHQIFYRFWLHFGPFWGPKWGHFRIDFSMILHVVPRAAQERPRAAKSGQKRPKSGPRAAKRAPKGDKSTPRAAQQTGTGFLLRFQNGLVAAVAGHDLTSCGATAARSPLPACLWHSFGSKRPFDGGPKSSQGRGNQMGFGGYSGGIRMKFGVIR